MTSSYWYIICLSTFFSQMAKELKFNFKKMGYNSQPTQIDIPVPICRIFISYLFTILQESNYVQIQKPKMFVILLSHFRIQKLPHHIIDILINLNSKQRVVSHSLRRIHEFHVQSSCCLWLSMMFLFLFIQLFVSFDDVKSSANIL